MRIVMTALLSIIRWSRLIRRLHQATTPPPPKQCPFASDAESRASSQGQRRTQAGVPTVPAGKYLSLAPYQRETRNRTAVGRLPSTSMRRRCCRYVARRGNRHGIVTWRQTRLNEDRRRGKSHRQDIEVGLHIDRSQRRRNHLPENKHALVQPGQRNLI